MAQKNCNLCGSKYDNRIEFCFRDGKKLELSQGNLINESDVSLVDSQQNDKELSSLDHLDLGDFDEDINFSSVGDLLDINGPSISSESSLDFLTNEEEVEVEEAFFNPDEIDAFDDDETQDTVTHSANDIFDTKQYQEQVAQPLIVDRSKDKSEGNSSKESLITGSPFPNVPKERTKTDDSFANAKTLDLYPPNNLNDHIFSDGFSSVQSGDDKDNIPENGNFLGDDVSLFNDEVPSNNKSIFLGTMGVGVIIALMIMMVPSEEKVSSDIETIKTVQPVVAKKSKDASGIPIGRNEDDVVSLAGEIGNSMADGFLNDEKQIVIKEPTAMEGIQKVEVENGGPTEDIDGTVNDTTGEVDTQTVLPTENEETSKLVEREQEEKKEKEREEKEREEKKEKEREEKKEKKRKEKKEKEREEKKALEKKEVNENSNKSEEDKKPSENGEPVVVFGADKSTSCSLVVNSNVSSAKVYVDGKRMGKVRSKIPLDCGRHSLKVVAEGYLDAERSIQLNSSQTFWMDLKK
jgi:hypothetical protein